MINNVGCEKKEASKVGKTKIVVGHIVYKDSKAIQVPEEAMIQE